MFVLITLSLKSFYLKEKLNKLLINFFNVGFVNIERTVEKVVFKGFIDNEYDVYFYSLLDFMYGHNEYAGLFNRTTIMIRRNEEIIYNGSLYLFYYEWRKFKYPDHFEMSDEEYAAKKGTFTSGIPA